MKASEFMGIVDTAGAELDVVEQRKRLDLGVVLATCDRLGGEVGRRDGTTAR